MLSGQKEERMRYDRVMYRLLQATPKSVFSLGVKEVTTGGTTMPSTWWTPSHIRLIGTNPVIQSMSSGQIVTCQQSSAYHIKDNTASDKIKPDEGAHIILASRKEGATPVPLFPSDHFGLYSEFVLNTEKY